MLETNGLLLMRFCNAIVVFLFPRNTKIALENTATKISIFHFFTILTDDELKSNWLVVGWFPIEGVMPLSLLALNLIIGIYFSLVYRVQARYDIIRLLEL